MILPYPMMTGEAVRQYLKVKWFSEPPPKPISAIHFTAVTGLREGTGSVAAGEQWVLCPQRTVSVI